MAGLTVEQKKLAAEVWKYLVEVELKDTLADYEKEANGLDKAIAGINTSLGKANLDITAAEVEISEIEKSLTSVKPTVNAINKILRDFGFRASPLILLAKIMRIDLLEVMEVMLRPRLAKAKRRLLHFSISITCSRAA